MKYEIFGHVKKRTKLEKAGVLMVCALLLGIDIYIKKYVYIPLILVVALAGLLDKEHVISEAGVDIRYKLLGKVNNYRWSWDEITTLHLDYVKARPKVMVHIGKGIVTRTFIFEGSEVSSILKMAKDKNNGIFIG